MKYKVSKELFEAVMKTKVNVFFIKDNNIYYKDSILNNSPNFISIDTFFFKCKKWAYDNKYDIWSVTWGAVEFQCNEKYNGTKRITADSEQQAVLDAGEQIRKLLNK